MLDAELPTTENDMRSFTMLSLFALSACATTSVATGRPPTESIHLNTSDGSSTLTLTSSTQENVTHLAVPIDRVWGALPAAYQKLAIPITAVDTANFTIKNDGFKLRRQLGDVPLSRFIECGTTQIGANADSYDVYLTILTQLRKDESGSTSLITVMDALAKPIAFAQGYFRCSSKGVLETRIADAAKAQLQ
jgi:hypothetical protein